MLIIKAPRLSPKFANCKDAKILGKEYLDSILSKDLRWFSFGVISRGM